ncbi:lasso peptide biosynthesis PqqD family chaperone [Actinomadura macra]|uniref:lasso peptide biosynthesis PqqD family chaperone n=1 Tax=Actinomadura macra TaxID=46164 RepID=UPI0008313B9D|nr:lasso peptide biosynthesis PqqD family chaperone [Actinomadura macra]
MKGLLSRHVSMTETENGMVLLDERSGRYFQLNGTGATVVRMLGEAATVEDVIARLARDHPAQAERVPADVRALLDSLRSARLITS